MQRVGLACGVALIMCGGVFLPPVGLGLGLLGVALVLVAGRRSSAAVVGSGVLLGLPLGALVIGVTLWWGNGHHVDWSAIQTALLTATVGLLAYIAFLLRRRVRA